MNENVIKTFSILGGEGGDLLNHNRVIQIETRFSLANYLLKLNYLEE